ncbi:MAG TPA: AMP-binding protein [Clostridia bacterium]|nr:AMP-binding protein [Clostridia bacterium]
MKNKAYFETPGYRDLGSMLMGLVAFDAAKAVTWYDRAGAEHGKTYRELCRDAAAFAAALARNGFTGSHVAIVCDNSYEWLWTFFGITATGGVAVLVDVEQTKEMLVSMILRADAKLAVLNPAVAPLVRDALEHEGVRVVTIEGAAPHETLADFTARNPERDEENLALIRNALPDPEAVAVIAYTSGTSSQPKPVMLTQKGVALNACGSISMVKPTRRVFTSLPMYHTYGLTCGALCILVAGSELGICGDIKRISRDFVLFDAEILMAVPLLAEMIYRRLVHGMEAAGYKKALDGALGIFNFLNSLGLGRPMKPLVKAKQKGLGNLTTIVCGGAHLAHSVADNMFAFGILVLEGYGITECSPLVSVNRVCCYEPHSAGLLLPGYELRVENDELLITGEMLMKGYYKDPEATKEAFDGVWFRTGDMGYQNANGFLYITGRKKNLIVLKNGKKIAPEEIESYLAGAPLIREVIAHSAPSGESADDVRVAVTIYPDPEATMGMSSYEVLERMQRYVDEVNSRLPAYKQIQMVNLSSGEFEKTWSRKIKR